MTSYLMLLNAGDLTLYIYCTSFRVALNFPLWLIILLADLAQVDTIHSCKIDIQILHGVLNFV